MKKILAYVLVVALICSVVMWTKTYSELQALREYNSIDGDTPYKTLSPVMAPNDRVAKKIVSSTGDHEYVPLEAFVDLETGEWQMP